MLLHLTSLAFILIHWALAKLVPKPCKALSILFEFEDGFWVLQVDFILYLAFPRNSITSELCVPSINVTLA